VDKRQQTGFIISLAGVGLGFMGAFVAISKMRTLGYQLGSYFGASQSPVSVIISEPLVIIGILVAIAGVVYRTMGSVDDQQSAPQKPRLVECPVCKEQIVRGAQKCRYCNTELVWQKRSAS